MANSLLFDENTNLLLIFIDKFFYVLRITREKIILLFIVITKKISELTPLHIFRTNPYNTTGVEPLIQMRVYVIYNIICTNLFFAIYRQKLI